MLKLSGLWKTRAIRRNNTFFRKLLFYFIIIIVVMMLTLGYLSMLISGEILKKQISKSTSDYLGQILHSIDAIIYDCNSILVNLGFNNSVDSLINSNQDVVHMFVEYLDIIELLKTIKESNRYIDSIYLYISKHDKVISSNGVVESRSNFSDISWYNSLKTNREFYVDTHRIHNSVLNKDIDVISIIKGLPIISSSINSGALIFNINEDTLNSIISRKKIRDSEDIYIINNSGQIISCENKDNLYKIYKWSIDLASSKDQHGYIVTTINGIKNFVTYESSNKYKWKVVSIIPYDDLFMEQNRLKRLCLLLCIFNLFILLPIAGMMSKKLYSPILNIINILSRNEYINNNKTNFKDIKFINENVKKIIDEKQVAYETLEMIKPMARQKFITNLLNGNYNNANSIQQNFDILGIKFKQKKCLVLLIELDNAPEQDKFKNEVARNLFISELRETVISFFENKGYVIVAEEVKDFVLGVIINFSDSNYEENEYDNIYLLCIDLKTRIFEKMHDSVTIGLGKPINNSYKISKSFNEALQALSQKMTFGKNSVIRISDIEKIFNEEAYYENNHISNIIKTLKFSDIKACISDTCHMIDIMVEMGVDSRKLKILLYNLLNSIIFTLTEMNIDTKSFLGNEYDIIDSFYENEDIHDMKRWFADIFNKINIYMQENISASSDIIEKVKHFIENNYSKEITLKEIAEMSYMNASYLGKLFKKNEGMSFNQFLTNIRMEKAKELLLDTKMNISDISNKVGISNPKYFTYCFKRFCSMTPTEFRENHFGNMCK